MMILLTKGRGWVYHMLTIADKGGGGAKPPQKNMAEIICTPYLIRFKIS